MLKFSLFTAAEKAATVSADEFHAREWAAKQEQAAQTHRDEAEVEGLAELAAERAYERHLEDAGYDEARFQEQQESPYAF